MGSGLALTMSGDPASWDLKGWREGRCLGPTGPHQFVLPSRVKPPRTPVLETPASTMTRLPGGAASAALWVSGGVGAGAKGDRGASITIVVLTKGSEGHPAASFSKLIWNRYCIYTDLRPSHAPHPLRRCSRLSFVIPILQMRLLGCCKVK